MGTPVTRVVLSTKVTVSRTMLGSGTDPEPNRRYHAALNMAVHASRHDDTYIETAMVQAVVTDAARIS
ncbi:MAG: hypothetical protein KJO34_13485 [Deltaproteobacteria bacterium]|nr:hypothetical protein [Deltaproteobacteria bacterium]